MRRCRWKKKKERKKRKGRKREGVGERRKEIEV